MDKNRILNNLFYQISSLVEDPTMLSKLEKVLDNTISSEELENLSLDDENNLEEFYRKIRHC